MSTKRSYVLPVPHKLRGQLLQYNRLYAYPVKPELPPAEFVILDSGAFGLSQQGKIMDDAYFASLNEHYKSFGASNNKPIIACAPDSFPNPTRSMKQWEQWHKLGYNPIAPVIQFPEKRLDLRSVIRQCEFYKSQEPPFVFISNFATALEMKKYGIEQAIKLVRKILKPNHIHLLGAGWSRGDIITWSTITGWNSIDSIAYYTTSEKWGNGDNAKIAQELVNYDNLPGLTAIH